MNKKDIINRNGRGQYHGYQEMYVRNKISLRTSTRNNHPVGYYEIHLLSSKRTVYYIK